MTFQDPALHPLRKSTITVINQFCYFSYKLNFSSVALIIIEINGINEITFNYIMEYTFVATLIQIQALN